MRTLLFDAKVRGLLSSTVQLVKVDDHCAIRFLDVLQSALGETSVRQLFHWITIGNSNELVQTSSRNPSAAFDPVLQRRIQGGAVNACLPAGNNFHSV